MKPFHISILILLSLISLDGFSQVIRCYTPEMNKRNHFELEEITSYDKTDLFPEDSLTYTVPVVFHVIYSRKGFQSDALSDALFESQIKALNEAFGRYGNGINSSDISTNAKIRFCLAKKDPNGQITNGITRILNSYYANLPDKDGTDDQNLKTLIGWDRKKYLNVWIVNSIDGADNIAGYAYLPRAIVPIKSGIPTPDRKDGIVLNYKFVGVKNPFGFSAYQEGETLVHEVGHYFDLMHTWGKDDFTNGEGGCGDDDGIFDTPDCDKIFNSKFPSCSKPNQCGQNRQTENYMDYSDERCSNLFTVGQITKMRKIIRKYRPELVSCSNLKRIGSCFENECIDRKIQYVESITINPNPSNGNFILNYWLEDSKQISFSVVNALGQLVYSSPSYNLLAGTLPLDFSFLNSGIYTFVFTGTKKTIYQKIIIQKN